MLQASITAIESSMNTRGERLKNVKDKMNCVEDDVFEQFCMEIGVVNIRWARGHWGTVDPLFYDHWWNQENMVLYCMSSDKVQ